MRKAVALVLLATGAMVLTGCGRGGGIFGRARPDEFAVQRQAPLVVPPDFAIEPPKAGAPRPANTNTQQQTLDAMFGGPAERSEAEKNTVGAAGRSAPGIRSAVGDPKTNTVAKGELTRDILAAPQGDGREAQTSAGS